MFQITCAYRVGTCLGSAGGDGFAGKCQVSCHQLRTVVLN
jgi:hypothetical protein